MHHHEINDKGQHRRTGKFEGKQAGYTCTNRTAASQPTPDTTYLCFRLIKGLKVLAQRGNDALILVGVTAKDVLWDVAQVQQQKDFVRP